MSVVSDMFCGDYVDCDASLCVTLLLFFFLHCRTDKYTVRKRCQPEIECSPSAIQHHTAVTLAHTQCHALCNHLIGGPNLDYIWDFCHELYIGGNLCVYTGVGGVILFVSLLVQAVLEVLLCQHRCSDLCGGQCRQG